MLDPPNVPGEFDAAAHNRVPDAAACGRPLDDALLLDRQRVGFAGLGDSGTFDGDAQSGLLAAGWMPVRDEQRAGGGHVELGGGRGGTTLVIGLPWR
ncbi:hypothetical protein ACSDR0_38415 [Streptosporangium sp. G11]|uniref:hypothetical protein n=1 Tax=Streptosporangium sp. G11 TaxID=3436926 RepID=UPI003EBA142D